MATLAPPAVVQKAARLPLPYGLDSVVAWRPEGDRWAAGGVDFEVGTCDPASGFGSYVCEVNEVQTVTQGGGLTSYTITFSGQTTGAIAADATAAQIQTALEALSNVNPGDVSVTKAGSVVTIEFTGQYAHTNVGQVTTTPTGGTATVATSQQGAATLGLPRDLSRNLSEYGSASDFTIIGHFQCSPVGWGQNRDQDAATEHLISREIARVEQALWTGDLGNVPNFSAANGFPAATSVGSFTEANIWQAISTLEQELAEVYGSVGVIHMNRYLASIALDKGLETKGGRLYTKLGTPVVAGAGYGSGKIVASPALFGYRSDIETSTNRPGDQFALATNDLYAIAERQYLLGFEPCGLLQATITA